MHLDLGAGFTSGVGLHRIADLRLLAELVDGEVDPMPLALRGDLDRAVAAIEHERHGDERLQALPWAPRVGET